MREYSSREKAERDPELDLKIVYTCDKCGREREDYPYYNVGGVHYGCGGTWEQTGESYNA
jgi:hypothetical protein